MLQHYQKSATVFVACVSIVYLLLSERVFAAEALKKVRPETPEERTTRLKNFYDKNSDGIVDRGEWYQNHFARVMHADVNKDREIVYSQEACDESQRSYLQSLDRNKDEVVTEQEVMEHVESQFLKLDRNNNGQLELTEL